MQVLHPHAEALDRIGKDVVMEHFEIGRQTWWEWRRRGVPDMVRKPLILLAMRKGLEMSNCKAIQELRFPRKNVAQSGASPAVPA